MTEANLTRDPSEDKRTTSQQTTKDSSQLLGKESKKLSQDKIRSELTDTVQNKKMQPVSEALSAVKETQNAVDLLDKKNTQEAKMALERALGKIEIALSNYPDIALIPFSVNLNVIDSFVDEDTVDRITSEVRDFIDEDRFQAARLLLRDFACEIDAVSVNLPIATYPDAIRSASKLLEQGKTEACKAALLNALHSLVIMEQHICLPVLRAQALIDEVGKQVNNKQINKEQVQRFLNDASHQLTLAEKFGYGNRAEDFRESYETIEKIKNSISQDQDSQGFLVNMKKKLQSLKEQISGKREEPSQEAENEKLAA